MKKRKFATFLRPKLTKRRKAEFQMRYLAYVMIVLVGLYLFLPWIQAGFSAIMNRIGAPTVKPPITDDGIYDIDLCRVNTVDLVNENAAVTATAGWMSINGGDVIAATSLASGYMEWSGYTITEGDEITVECQGSANHYPQLRTFTVGDINEGTYDLTYKILGTMQLWGMDQSEDASVITVMTGTDLLYNGTAEEDQLAADAGTEYAYVINVNCDAFDEEYFGVEEYTQISGSQYTYIPAIYIKASTSDLVDDVAQDGVPLKELYVSDDGTSHHYIFQFIPMREDEDLTEGQYKITFTYTPDAASGDTLDITFHPETRLDRAEKGILSQAATETVAQLTTT